MELSLGLSPCPNDTYIFYALLHKAIDTEGITFIPHFADVEELNHKAEHEEFDVTKISYHAFLYLTASYHLLDSGGALGRACGPLLIAREPMSITKRCKVAVPGIKTTANFLLDYYLPNGVNKEVLRFDQIESAVSSGQVDAGVIIHENRFTYLDHGLVSLQDLGQHWEESTGCPIPLGGIVAHHLIPVEIRSVINRLIFRSLTYAHEHRDEVIPFVRHHAQEMQDEVMWQHIELYVNEFSLSLGTEGQRAVCKLFDTAVKLGRIPAYESPFADRSHSS